jgi:hypothetical protein
MYQYFVKVVPTIYETSNGNVLNTNQYSVTEHFKPLKGENAHGLPGMLTILLELICNKVCLLCMSCLLLWSNSPSQPNPLLTF